jgi:hypothetical protein
MPCSDDLDFHGYTTTSITQVEHGKQEGSAESCSPICMCVCCGQSLVKPELIVFAIRIPVLEIDKLISNYQFSLKQLSANIWQPPKMS